MTPLYCDVLDVKSEGDILVYLESGVQLFEIVVIDILLVQGIDYGMGVHLWLGLWTLFWLRVPLCLEYLLRESVCCLLESAPSNCMGCWLRPISSVE